MDQSPIKRKRGVNLREYLLLDMNAVIRLLILSDMLWVGATGMLGPVFALFIVDFIPGATIATAGIAAAVFLITKSIAQIPFAATIDRICGEKDDYWFIVVGSIIAALIPLAYLFIDSELQLYIVQFALGIATAASFPSYMALFTRHTDKGKEGTTWGIYFTLVDLISAGTASLGGILAERFGFAILIVTVTMISLIGTLLLIGMRPHLFLANEKSSD